MAGGRAGFGGTRNGYEFTAAVLGHTFWRGE